MYNENEQQLNEQVQQETPSVEQNKPEVESNKEYNLRLLRERAEAAERRAAQLEYERSLAQQQNQHRSDPEEEFDVEDDGYIEGRQLKKYVKTFKNEIERLKKESEQTNKQLKSEMALATLQAQYKDFSQVVNEDSIRKLQQEQPDLFESIAMNPDVYKRGSSIYNLIKKYPSSQENFVSRNTQQQSMPRSAAGVGSAPSQSPLVRFAEADRRVLSDEDKAAVRKRLEDIKSRSY